MNELLAYYPQLSMVRDALKGDRRRIFIVGGALRDLMLARRGTDFDFAVDGGSIALSRRLARRIKGVFVLLDAEHGSARIVKKIDGVSWTFDFTDWRAGSIQKDLALRDFTVNAMAMDFMARGPKAGDVLEVKGSRRDIKSGVVRMVNPGVFRDDPLRLLRAFTLRATLGFKIDAKTRLQINKDAHLIEKPAVERVREELFKVLASSRAQETLLEMDKISLLPRVIPQITVMFKVPQGGYHHLDVWKHSLEVVLQLERIMAALGGNERIRVYLNEIIGGGHSRLALLKMAALLHDIGKPETRQVKGDRTTFHGHEHAGEKITRQVARQLRLSVRERYFLENAVRMHLRPGYLSNFKRPSEKAVFRYLRDTGDEAAALAILALADQAATCGPLTSAGKHKHHSKVCHMLIGRYFELKDLKPKQRLLTGHDLIKTFKLKPSELFGRVLGAIEEAAALGRINTKDEALALARQLVRK